MKIFVIGKFYPESFSQHIAETFSAMGHKVARFEIGMTTTQSKSPLQFKMRIIRQTIYDIYSKSGIYSVRSMRKILSSIAKENDIDLILSCHDLLTPKEINALKAITGAPIVLWFPDAISNFRKAMFLDADYDVLFFKEPYIVDVLRKEYGKNVFYLPECCNPKYHNKFFLTPAEFKKYSCDIATAGNMHTARSAILKGLTQYDIKVWGNPAPSWMILGGIETMIQNEFVGNEAKSKAFSAAKVVLNNVYPTEIYGVNVRTFEIAASGAFQLISWRREVGRLFNINEEIACFHSMSELKEKIDYFLRNEDHRRDIGERSFRRTMKEHTYQHRLELMLATVEGEAEGFSMPDYL